MTLFSWPRVSRTPRSMATLSTTWCSSTFCVVIAALYDAPLPPLRGSAFTSSQFDFVPVAMILVALVLYLWGGPAQ